jgi:hypothetical protein
MYKTVTRLRQGGLASLAIIVVASAVLSFFMLERDHGWGDDFAAYIMQGRSLVTGQVAEYVQESTFTRAASGYRFVGPVTVPWGYPLMLAPVIALVGTKILALKGVNTLCYAAFLVVFFFLARTRLRVPESLLLTSVFAFNSTLLRAQNDVISDIAFLLISTLGLLLIELNMAGRNSPHGGILLPLAIGLSIFAAALTRLNGFLLLLPLGCAQLIQARDPYGASTGQRRVLLGIAIPYVVVAVCYLCQALILPSEGGALQAFFRPNSGIAQLPGSGLFSSVEAIPSNLAYYFWLPRDLTDNTIFDSRLVYLVLLLFALSWVLRRESRNLPMLAYGLATMGLYVLVGGKQGIRYIYPVLPILVLFSYGGMRRAASWAGTRLQPVTTVLIYGCWCALVVSSVVASGGFALQNMAAGRMHPRWWGAYSPASAKMFDWVRHHTPADSIVIFFKPRALRLLTDRNSFLTLTCDNLPKGDYVISVRDGDSYNQIAPERIESCPGVALTPVYDKDDFIIYRISSIPRGNG